MSINKLCPIFLDKAKTSQEEKIMEGREGHVVMYPAFGMGHFLPMVELAKRLSGHHGLKVTFLVSDWAIKPQQLAEYKNLFASNSILDIDFVELPKLEQDGNTEADFLKRMQENMVNTKPLLESALKDAKDSFPVSAFITDFFCTDIFGVPESLGIPVYVYFVSAASMLCVMLYALELATKRPLPIKPTDTEPVFIPGLPPLMAKDLPSTFVDTSPRSKSFCEWFMGHCIRLRSAKGFLINTFAEMETVQLAALAETEKTFEYYPIGPLIKSSLFEPTAAEAGGCRPDCLEWLDRHPLESVVYFCFGSNATLTPEQIRELATGLESSGRRFLWVLRKPNKEHGGDGESDGLPEGFEERCKGRGLVVKSWAPQVDILSHEATGGFVSHCGWNSTLESILCGVPTVAWPLGAEQRMNAVMLRDQLGVAVGVKEEEGGIIKSEEIERALNALMGDEGKEVRSKMKALSDAAKASLGDGGSSSESLAMVASLWKSDGCK